MSENISVSQDFIRDAKKAAETMLTVQARILAAVVKLERETGIEGPSQEVCHSLHTAAYDLASQWIDFDIALACEDL